jgi:hypothetical protein
MEEWHARDVSFFLSSLGVVTVLRKVCARRSVQASRTRHHPLLRFCFLFFFVFLLSAFVMDSLLYFGERKKQHVERK